MENEDMTENGWDKCTENWSVRIPGITKDGVDRLSDRQRKELKGEVLLTIARVLHKHEFDPSRYLSSKNQ